MEGGAVMKGGEEDKGKEERRMKGGAGMEAREEDGRRGRQGSRVRVTLNRRVTRV
jgi:hypothetical protein